MILSVLVKPGARRPPRPSNAACACLATVARIPDRRSPSDQLCTAGGCDSESTRTTFPVDPTSCLDLERVVVFVDGDFWHGFRFPEWKDGLTPFWREKIARTRQRDQMTFGRLRRLGWTVIRVWEHEVRRDVDGAASRIERSVRGCRP